MLAYELVLMSTDDKNETIINQVLNTHIPLHVPVKEALAEEDCIWNGKGKNAYRTNGPLGGVRRI